MNIIYNKNHPKKIKFKTSGPTPIKKTNSINYSAAAKFKSTYPIIQIGFLINGNLYNNLQGLFQYPQNNYLTLAPKIIMSRSTIPLHSVIFYAPLHSQIVNIIFEAHQTKNNEVLNSHSNTKIDIQALLNHLKDSETMGIEELTKIPKVGSFWLNEGLLYNTVFIDKTDISNIQVTDKEGIPFITLSSRPRLIAQAMPD
jgi:hypothetical protein